jgi:predicted dehydrogenase
METESTSRVAVVGLGQVGRHYADIVRDLGFDIVGVDADATARDEFARQYDVETYADLESTYEMGLDAVVVSTPNSFHELAAVPALEAGLDTFIEKPIAHNYESAKRIVDAAEESSATCMVGYYLSYFEWIEALKSYIEDGYFGDISHIECRYLYRRGVPRPGSWYTSKEIAGGGVLQDKGSFVLDLLSYFGAPLDGIESVTAKARTEFGHRDSYTALGNWGTEGEERIFDVEDSVSAFIEFEGETTATIETSWALNGPKEHTYAIRGSDAGAYLDMHEPELKLYGVSGSDPDSLVDGEVRPLFSEDVIDDAQYGFDVDHETLRKRIFRDFWRCARENERPERGHPGQALAVQRAIADIYEDTSDVETVS